VVPHGSPNASLNTSSRDFYRPTRALTILNLQRCCAESHVVLPPLRCSSPREERHAKEVAASSPEELHKVASVFFEDPRTEVTGWQFLWEAHSGMRTEETKNNS
jgi:hypothetical protein